MRKINKIIAVVLVLVSALALCTPALAKSSTKTANHSLGDIVNEPRPDFVIDVNGWKDSPAGANTTTSRAMVEVAAYRGMAAGASYPKDNADTLKRQWPIIKLIVENDLNKPDLVQLDIYLALSSTYNSWSNYSGGLKSSGVMEYNGISLDEMLNNQLAYAKKLYKDKYGVEPSNIDAGPRNPDTWIANIRNRVPSYSSNVFETKIVPSLKDAYNKASSKDSSKPGGGTASAEGSSITPIGNSTTEVPPVTITADPANIYATQMITKQSIKVNKVTVLKKGVTVNVVGTNAKKSYYWVSPVDNADLVYKVASKYLTAGRVTKISGLPKTLTLKVGEFKKLTWKTNTPVLTNEVYLTTSDEAVCTLNDALLEPNEMIFYGVIPGTCTITFKPLYGSATVTMKVVVK